VADWTPAQTAGPFVSIGTEWTAHGRLGDEGSAGALRVRGRVLDGAGAPVTDAMIEFWQGDGSGFARVLTDAEGSFTIVTRKPRAVEGAPHIDVAIFARGLLNHLSTRCYFPDEAAANAADPFLAGIRDEDARATLVAVEEGDGGLRFDVHLQGERETAFFWPASSGGG
jgi:protocatechuate 3,4-dioxygenase alpha subunit